MTIQSSLRPLVASTLACLLTLSLINCGETKADRRVSNAGEAGASGNAGSSAQAGQGPALCGSLPTYSVCDPLTAAQCHATGETCDYNFTTGAFVCLTAPKFSLAGGPCGPDGFDCGPSTTCDSTDWKCKHFCCSDRDCDQGSCYSAIFTDGEASVGVCGDEFVELGAGGAAGAGGTAGESGAAGEPSVGGAGAGGEGG